MLLRLDTMLGAADIACVLVEEGGLSAGDCVRLRRCSKKMSDFLPERLGLLYVPMLRTFPFITGLSPNRHSSYYLSILNGYYNEQNFSPDRAARIKLYLGMYFPFGNESADITVRECVRMCRTMCFSLQGRRLVMGCLDELLVVYQYMSASAIEVLHRVRTIVRQAFCVQRRRLQPGKPVRHLNRRSQEAPLFRFPVYDYESDEGI